MIVASFYNNLRDASYGKRFFLYGVNEKMGFLFAVTASAAATLSIARKFSQQ